MKRNNLKRNKGFTLLMAIITTGILLLISFVVVNLAQKQLSIVNSNQQSQYSFYNTDSGTECALFWDTKNTVSPFDPYVIYPTSIACKGQDITFNAPSPVVGGYSTTTFSINLTKGCVVVDVTKKVGSATTTTINSRGYNTCTAGATSKYERGIVTTYSDSASSPVSSPNRVLNMSVGGAGGGTVTSGGVTCLPTCSKSYVLGTVGVAVTPNPNANSFFAGWSGDCTGAGNCILTMDSDKTVTAQFDLKFPTTLTLNKNGAGNGTITSAPSGINCGASCNSIYDSGTSVVLTATANAGSLFTAWSIGGCSGTGPCTVNMLSNTTVNATFLIGRNLTTAFSGTGSGTVVNNPLGVSCGANCQTYADGTNVVLTANPNAGNIFTSWTGCSSVSGTDCTVSNISGNITVTAGFAILPTATITANPTSVLTNNASTLTWSSTNATACTGSNGWSGAKATSGTQSTGNLAVTTTYTLSCTNAAGTGASSATVTVSATPAPTVTISASPTSVAPNGVTTVTWSSTNAGSGCTVTGYSNWTGTSGSQTTGPLTTTTTFTATCTGPGGTTSNSTTVTVNQDATPPTIVITAPSNGATVSGTVPITATVTDNSGGSGVNTVYFYYDSTNFISSDQSSPYSASWTTSGVPSGSHNITVKATDLAGNLSTSVITVNIGASATPTVVLNSNLSAISYGTSATLDWTTTNAASCTASNDNPANPWSGSKTVPTGSGSTGNLTDTTTFFLTCINGSKTAQDQVTVTVDPPTVTTFNYTGGVQTFRVPSGVTSITVDARGASGGSTAAPTTGGNGGRLQAIISVTSGETINIYVGGAGGAGVLGAGVGSAGGFNGGGSSTKGGCCSSGGGGGGASDIRRGGSALANRVIVAGGGGGAGGGNQAGYGIVGGNGGAAGGLTGSAGGSGYGGVLGGGGGGQASGGAGRGQAPADGTFGLGGAGSAIYGAGGGGAGYYGGGGGADDGSYAAGGGGGGGSSWTSGTNTNYTSGYQSGNGQIILTY